MRETKIAALWITCTVAEAARRFVTFVLQRRAIISIFTFSLLWGHLAVAADFQVGADAYNRGDYATALHQFRDLAKQGDASAQRNLGLMYNKGQGVPQDDTQALYWYRLAAAQGYASAQSNLGVMYANGQGVPQDYTQGYAWFNLAAAQGNENATKGRDILLNLMTSAQVAEGQKLSRSLAQQIAKGSKLDLH